MKQFLIAFTLFLCGVANTQILEILDANTLQPIKEVLIESKSNTTKLFTAEDGKVDVTIFLNNTIKISKNEYNSIITTWDELQKNKFKVFLLESINSLEEIVVSASRFNEKRKDVAQKIQLIKTTELEQMNQTSTADMIANSGNVMVQKSQQGGGSPIIRGFETNKVLMVMDGVRLNNAIYRGGHLQNIITLDNSSFEKVEVVYGPGSVVYGSDALGGVMHFYTKNPLLSEDGKLKIKANAFARLTSANSGYASHADVSVGGKKFGSLTSFTYSNYGDLRQGAVRNPFYGNFGARNWYVERIKGIDSIIINKDTNLQVGCAYTQYDLMQKFLFKQSENISHIINFQYSTSLNIDRYDRLVQLSSGLPKYAEWYYGPQKRLFSTYTLNLNKKTKLYDHARFITGYQQIEESRIDRKYKKNMQNHRIEKLDIVTFNADFDKKNGKNEIRYGIDGFYNKVNSTAFVKDIISDTIGKLDTRYPDGGSSMSSFAIYATHTLEINPKLILNDGIRYTNVTLNSKFTDKTFFPFPFNSVTQKNDAISGNLGLVYMPFSSTRITGTFSTGFRAPNVDDLSKVFESNTSAIIVPNPNLKPEYTFTYELGLSQTINKKVTSTVNAYYTDYKNALNVAPSLFEGQDSIVYNGSLSQVKTTVNSTRAYIYGLEGGLNGNLNDNLSIYGTINYTYGRIETDTTDYPLDHIPPVFGKVGFIATIKKFKGEFFVNYSGWKKIKDYNMIGEDNFTYATANGMPAWYTLNCRLTYRVSKYLSAQIACENILDVNYRQFASNISAPGRNLIFTLRGNF